MEFDEIDTASRPESGSSGGPERTASLADPPPGWPPSADDPTPPAPGTVARFRILRPHARGGLGVVSVALDGELHREVAFKRIRDDHADDPESRARFLREAEITGGLEHPGIVPVYGMGTSSDGRPYYAMRLIRGETLGEAIARHRGTPAAKSAGDTLGLRQLLRRFIDACNAVEYAHSRGVIHRDLKPSNVVVGKHGETLVIDWGLAKAVGREGVPQPPAEPALVPTVADSTLAGSTLGTPGYMSPEQAAGRPELLGRASDVYSLGATLYCLLTGRPPFEGGDLAEVLRRVTLGRFAPPRAVRPDIPPALDAICRKAMALRGSERYVSPKALADDIELWLADEPVGAWPEPVWVRSARWGRRHKPIMALGAAILVTTSLALAIGTRLIAIERDQVQRERNEAWRQRQEAQLERDRAVEFSLQAASKELQLRDAYARRLLLEREPKLAFLAASMGFSSREDLIRLHPLNDQLKEDRVDSLILRAKVMGGLDAESWRWVVDYLERRGDGHPKTTKFALLQAREACVEFARGEPTDPWRTLWCIERLITVAKLQRDFGIASDALETFLLCHDYCVAMGTRIPSMRALVLYNDACIQAQCAALLTSLGRDAERHRSAEAAMMALKKALGAGYKDIDQMRSDPDLDPLRSRSEFQDMIDDLAFPLHPFTQ